MGQLYLKEKLAKNAAESIVKHNPRNKRKELDMWKQDTYYRNGVKIGRIWERPGAFFWTWGYTGGFVASSRTDAMRQVERM
jgi:hypothetical protein